MFASTASPRLASPRLASVTLTAALLLGGCTDGRTAAGTGLGAPSIDHIDLGPVTIGSRPHDTAFLVPVIDADETSLPVCDDSAMRVVGPAGRPCAGMDSQCTRGVRDVAGCCHPEPRFHGTGCGDGMECNTGGDCVATSTAPWEAASIIGDQTWLDIVGDGEDSLITLDPTGFQARLDNASLVDVHPDDGAKVNVGDVHIAHGRDRGLEAVAIAAPSDVSRRSVYLLTAPASAEVCVVRGDFDTMGPVSADCDSPGATRVRCPAGDADTDCLVLRDGGVRVTGENLAMVFEMGTFGPQPRGTDVRHALTVDSLDHRWRTTSTIAALTAVEEPTADAEAMALAGPIFGCRPSCRVGQVQIKHVMGCAVPSLQTRTCGVLGCWGPWQGPPEVCDGQDNDCDGSIDEGGAPALCDDHIGCTIDWCGRKTALSPIICGHTAFAPLCALSGSDNDQQCIFPRCTGLDGKPSGLHLTPVASGDVTTPVDPVTGCSLLLRNSFCTNIWDSCDCNGLDICTAAPNGMDATGCTNNLVSMTGSLLGIGPNALTINWPCEIDAQYCTTGECCEQDTRCRGLELSYPDATERQAEVDRCNSYPLNRPRRTTPTGNPVKCGPEVVPPNRCNDGNACTEQRCMEPSPFGFDPWTFRCPVTGFNYGSPDGCDGLTNEGCAKFECGDGSTGGNPDGVCGIVPSDLAVTECSQSSGTFEGVSACIVAACAYGACERLRSDALCPDPDLPCTAPPHCLAPFGSGSVSGCTQPTLDGWCVIDGTCVAPGTPMFDNPCWQCSGGYNWSLSPTTTICDDHLDCTINDRCAAGQCAGTTGPAPTPVPPCTGPVVCQETPPGGNPARIPPYDDWWQQCPFG